MTNDGAPKYRHPLSAKQLIIGMMTIDQAISEWQTKARRMGCVSATDWVCKRVDGFYPVRLTRYTSDGTPFDHVVATNGVIRIDLAPYNDGPDE